MPGGPVLTGGPEERLSAEQFTIIFEGKPFDLRLMIRPDDPRPWNQPDFSEEDKVRVMIVKSENALGSHGDKIVAATFVSTGNGERELETHEKGRRMKARILRFLFARVAVLMVGSC